VLPVALRGFAVLGTVVRVCDEEWDWEAWRLRDAPVEEEGKDGEREEERDWEVWRLLDVPVGGKDGLSRTTEA
jgi:hypothetical protein